MNRFNLEERTAKFAEEIIDLCKEIKIEQEAVKTGILRSGLR